MGGFVDHVHVLPEPDKPESKKENPRSSSLDEALIMKLLTERYQSGLPVERCIRRTL
jgi:hypothetical protein